MKKRTIALCALSLSLMSGFVYADNWIRADKVGDEKIDNYYARCYYKTPSYGKFADKRITIVIEGSTYNCPYSIEYNPLTNEWK